MGGVQQQLQHKVRGREGGANLAAGVACFFLWGQIAAV